MLFVNVLSQRFDIILEGSYSFFCNPAGGQWFLATEGLLHAYIASCGQFIQLNAEVTRRTAGLFPDECELRAINAKEQGHYRQSQLRMEERVKFPEHGQQPVCFSVDVRG